MAEGTLFNIGKVKFMCELLFYVMYSFMYILSNLNVQQSNVIIHLLQ